MHELFVLRLLKGGFPLEVAYDQQNSFYVMLFLLYHAFSLFIVEGFSQSCSTLLFNLLIILLLDAYAL